MKTDKLLHFLIAFPIFLLAVKVMAPFWAVVTVAIIGIGKEVVRDMLMKKGSPEILDAIFTVLGALAAWGLTLSLLLIPYIASAQVGIGTQDPRATLHIADADTLRYGLRIDKVPYQHSDSILTVNKKGEVGYSAIAAVTGISLEKYEAITVAPGYWRPQNASQVQYHWEDIGLEVQVSVGPGRTALIVAHYYIPFGTAMIDYGHRGYFGATFYKDNAEVYTADAKTQMGRVNSTYDNGGGGHNAYIMKTVSNTYAETITNTGTTTLTISYKVLAYVEHVFGERPSGPTYIIGRFATRGTMNANWGAGKLTITKIEI